MRRRLARSMGSAARAACALTVCALAVCALAVCAFDAPARAADLDGEVSAPPEGLPCQNPAVQVFPSVWLGHFSGGYSHYLGPGQQIVLDYRDEKLCFPSRISCNQYIAAMRRDFHRPEGYFTCLPIR